ncbi:conserved Plasmodium protein, unknown function [Plasmodium vinckei vinckei]|uniref:Uncharacterized protein n=1 Tax=Plasmodium vinckei vinckei TaxID=54757 RepID=A0A449BX57_PLAVN|nr:conserved Plasmodium protein, unknown function [Plasmodium vinckei vinckei]KEG03668.1 hypothetical protein YYE_01692 [Plasmodium vinckei vinckei]VEV57962.1 conserved Plasmodium protein, unknown function [Plasmodium vinckei vinckei]
MKGICVNTQAIKRINTNWQNKGISTHVKALLWDTTPLKYKNIYNTNLKTKNFTNLIKKNEYNTYKNRGYNYGYYNNNGHNYMSMNNNDNTPNNMPNYGNNGGNYPNPKYDSSNNFYQSKYNTNTNNENTDNNITYQYYSIFGSTAMCLIKPVFPDCIVNKNKSTIYGKGGLQFVFMKRQSNCNRYDKNNKMNIFLKINNLSNMLLLTDIENLTSPITIKGSNNNYLIIDRHANKNDHIVIKYKYNPSNTTENNNFNDINNIDMEVNENANINEDQKNNYEELHVSCSFSEFLFLQKATNLLLPQLIGWTKHN